MTAMRLRAAYGARPAVFLDKDGTLIEDVPYNIDAERIRFYPEAPSALAQLHAQGYLLIVVTNQPGIAHGYFGTVALEATGTTIDAELASHDAPIAGFYYCPHHPEGQVPDYAIACGCRKPLAGMLLQAAHEHGIDLSASWMIGDILNDVEAGNRAGCRTVLVDRGNETEWLHGEHRVPDHVARNLIDAAQFIAAQNVARISEGP